MEQDLEKRILNAMENAKPWERVPTTLKGIFLVKAPSRDDNGTVMLEVNPSDKLGNPIKRRGLFIRRKSELESFKLVLLNKKLELLLDTLEDMFESNEDQVNFEPIVI